MTDHSVGKRGPDVPVMLSRYDILTIRDALAQLAERMGPEAHMEDPGVMSLAAYFDSLAERIR